MMNGVFFKKDQAAKPGPIGLWFSSADKIHNPFRSPVEPAEHNHHSKLLPLSNISVYLYTFPLLPCFLDFTAG